MKKATETTQKQSEDNKTKRNKKKHTRYHINKVKRRKANKKNSCQWCVSFFLSSFHVLHHTHWMRSAVHFIPYILCSQSRFFELFWAYTFFSHSLNCSLLYLSRTTYNILASSQRNACCYCCWATVTMLSSRLALYMHYFKRYSACKLNTSWLSISFLCYCCCRCCCCCFRPIYLIIVIIVLRN